jgi:hypothetical protein
MDILPLFCCRCQQLLVVCDAFTDSVDGWMGGWIEWITQVMRLQIV